MALRTLSPVTRIVIAHVTKAAAEGLTRSKPFGSIFIENLARSTWEVRASDEDTESDLVMALYHQKVNSGRRLRRPLVYRWHYEDDAITVEETRHPGPARPRPAPEPEGPTPVALTRNSPQTVADLAVTVAREPRECPDDPEPIRNNLCYGWRDAGPSTTAMVAQNQVNREP